MAGRDVGSAEESVRPDEAASVNESPLAEGVGVSASPSAEELPAPLESAPPTIDLGTRSKEASTLGRSDAGRRESNQLPTVHPPGYQIVGELGRGGMGVVYLAEDLKLKRHVGLKMIRADSDTDQVALERFRIEAEAIANLQHPNIVQIYEVGEHEGCPFIALEYLDGGSLRAKIRAGRIPPREAASMVRDLAAALAHAHERGVIHRDIKPGNVLLTLTGVVKISDFGLAKRFDLDQSQLTPTGAVLGTPAYMSPEQALGRAREVGPLTDVYSLGAVLYELLTGDRPFHGENAAELIHRVVAEEPTPPSKSRPGIDRDIETICLKAMAKESRRRYSSAQALADDLGRYLAGEPIVARRYGWLDRAAARVRRNPAAAAAIVVLAVGLALTGRFFAESRASNRVAALTREFEDALDLPVWSAEQRARLFEMEAEIGRLRDSSRADASRRLDDRFVQQVRVRLGAARIEPGERQAIEDELAWFAERDARRSAELRAELHGRLRKWQSIVELAAPFERAGEIFARDKVAAKNGGLVALADDGLPLATTVESRDPIRVEATYSPGWEQADRLGVFVHDAAQREPKVGVPTKTRPSAVAGYGFILRPAYPAEDDLVALNPAKASRRPLHFDETTRKARLSIERQGRTLRSKIVDLPAGPVTIFAKREGDRLEVQVAGGEPLIAHDLFPLGGSRRGVVAIDMPSAATLAAFRAETQPLPRSPSPLEKADVLFSEGKYAEAASLFDEHLRRAPSPDQAEANCKRGFCDVELRRESDAVKAFELAMAQPGERWPAIAAMQLALLHSRAKRLDDLTAILFTAKVRFDAKTLSLYVSEETRRALFEGQDIQKESFLFVDREQTHRLERLAQIADLFDDASVGFAVRWNLGKAQALAGDESAAAATFEAILPEAILPEAIARSTQGPAQTVLFTHILRWYAWLLCRTGRGTEALARLNDLAINHPRRIRESFKADVGEDPIVLASLPIWLERARVHSHLNRHAEAEADVDHYLNRLPASVEDYNFHAPACLIKGFLRLRAGDEAGANQTWRMGSYSSFRRRIAASGRASRDLPDLPEHRHGVFDYLMLASLTGELTDDEAAKIYKRLLADASESVALRQAANLVNLSSASLRGMYRLDRPKEAARKMAFLELSPGDTYRMPGFVIFYQKLRDDLFAGKPTELQDEVLWDISNEMLRLVSEEAFAKSTFIQGALAWKGTTNFLGWAGLEKTLSPKARGQIAWLFGHRYHILGRPADAIAFFRIAAESAPVGSGQRRLAEGEIARLTKTSAK